MDSILLHEMGEELRRDRRQQTVQSEAVPPSGNSQTLEDKEHNIPFQDVLKYVVYISMCPDVAGLVFFSLGGGVTCPLSLSSRMIAYRAEDISQRLVPHELYVREEFENSVQFDVSVPVFGMLCRCAL